MDCPHDGVSDEFWDLWDDAVAEGFKAVHPVGNPMSHSTHVGFNAPVVVFSIWPTTTVNGSVPVALGARCAPLIVRQSRATGVGHIAAQLGCFIIDGASWLAVLVGVANNPDPVPPVRGTN